MRVQTVLNYRNSNLNKLTSNAQPLGKEHMAEEISGIVTGTLSQIFITKQCSPHPVSTEWNSEIKNPLNTNFKKYTQSTQDQKKTILGLLFERLSF